MILTRTPFRISFFGGGTDYPAWFTAHGGAVLSTTINKYCHISCRHLPPFFEHKHRIVYSKIENVRDIEDIQHPAARAILRWADVDDGLEIHHDGDLPARSGLGSSSAFSVGLIQAIAALRGHAPTRHELATNAIHVEQAIVGENVGSQDQVAAAFGGFNHIVFRRDASFEVTPMEFPSGRADELQRHLMLCFTGLSRNASEIAASTIGNVSQRAAELHRIAAMVDDGMAILGRTETPIEQFGDLLDAGWRYKRMLSDQISTPYIDDLYSTARAAGAIGGKLLGAGGGGFLLLFVPPERHARVRAALGHLVHVPFAFERSGSHVVLSESEVG